MSNRTCLSLALTAGLTAALVACPGRREEPPVNNCGNGKLDPGEQCDGAELDQWTCYEAGFDAGDMACGADCLLDTSGCIADPCWWYPCAAFGTAPSSVVADLNFAAANEAATELAGGDDMLDLHDLYVRNEAHGGPLRGLMMFVSGGWCPVCSDEAPRLPALYEALRDQGILIVGVVAEDNSGRAATPQFAASYGERYGWQFPVVSGRPSMAYWPSGDNQGALPFHLFVDLRDMRLYGRLVGGISPKLIRVALDDLAAHPSHDSDGVRTIDFDCVPGSGDQEPNDFDHAIDGSPLPFDLSGVLCPPAIQNDILIDEDVIDLGTLQAGAVIDVLMSRSTESHTYPIFILMRAGGSGWYQWGPGLLDAQQAGRQWVIDTTGHYLLSVFDGRVASGWYYGNIGSPTADQQCCEGGADHTYQLAISSFELAANESPLVVGQPRTGPLDTRDLRVFPFAASASVSHTFELSDSSDYLDPYLLLYDPVAHTVIDYNDDIDTANGNSNARLTWAPTVDQTVWVVVSYFSLYVRTTVPSYTLTVN
ncbi:MAG: redoxin domain-containing protein [Deltaproteobacteria bacterium]|nr:redoxin domain-containing protein [Deltaproteobacteria bacterium]